MSENPFSRKIDFSKYVRSLSSEFRKEVEGFCEERDRIIKEA